MVHILGASKSAKCPFQPRRADARQHVSPISPWKGTAGGNERGVARNDHEATHGAGNITERRMAVGEASCFARMERTCPAREMQSAETQAAAVMGRR